MRAKAAKQQSTPTDNMPRDMHKSNPPSNK
jgi:hypothetical protein